MKYKPLEPFEAIQ